jgi:DNA invertase Pin-like site-specific DNA recombinase
MGGDAIALMWSGTRPARPVVSGAICSSDVAQPCGFRVAPRAEMGRTGIEAALEALKAGDANALVVAKLDRLSRSLLDFAGLMAKAQQQGWGVIALEVQVDTSTASGEAMANMLATFAQFERRLIGQRTKEALAVEKASGVRLGRPSLVPRSVVRRIQRQRARGETLRAIAESLNRDNVPTAQGGAEWYAATVRYVLLKTS